MCVHMHMWMGEHTLLITSSQWIQIKVKRGDMWMKQRKIFKHRNYVLRYFVSEANKTFQGHLKQK